MPEDVSADFQTVEIDKVLEMEMTQLAKKNSETVQQVPIGKNLDQTADKYISSNFVSNMNK